MHDYEQYEYFAHIALRTGYRTVVPVSRLPEGQEAIEDWLAEECEIGRVRDSVAGLLFLGHIDDVSMVGFHREEKQPDQLPYVQSTPESNEWVRNNPSSPWPPVIVEAVSDTPEDANVPFKIVTYDELPPVVQEASKVAAKIMQEALAKHSIQEKQEHTDPEDDGGKE